MLPSKQLSLAEHKAARSQANRAVRAARDRIGTRLFKVALAWSTSEPATQAGRNEQIKATRGRKAVDGKTGINVAREAVEETARLIRLARRARRPKRSRSELATTARRSPVVLPKGSPDARLAERREEHLTRAKKRVLRSYERESPLQIEWVSAPSECTIALRTEEGWIKYGQRNRRGIVDAQYTVRAMARCPLPRIIDDRLILGATEAADVATGDGERVFAAAWARQSSDGPVLERGFAVVSASGNRLCTTLDEARRLMARGVRREVLAAMCVEAVKAVDQRRIGMREVLDAAWLRDPETERRLRDTLAAKVAHLMPNAPASALITPDALRRTVVPLLVERIGLRLPA